MKMCIDEKGFVVAYEQKVAKEGDICVQPKTGAIWKYSDKDPGDGVENVIIKSEDPEIFNYNPDLKF